MLVDEQRHALEAILRSPELPPDSALHRGPLVTIAVVTRDGLHHLERLFDGLARRTRYRPFEVVVVDNASRDSSRRWLRGEHGFPVEVIENPENRSFSEANNQALSRANGELTLILNNDVDPISPDWLSHLVQSLRGDPSVASVGALLLYPERVARSDREFRYPDLTVQHAGVRFAITGGRVRAHNVASGQDGSIPWLRSTREVGALTAACMLVRTGQLRQLGGFAPEYFYGSEDWDLSLRLAELGRLLVIGRAALYHHEYGTQDSYDRDEQSAYRRRNHLTFNGVWGPRLHRQLLLEHLGREGVLSGRALPTVSVAPDASPRLRSLQSELLALGWEPHREGGGSPLLALTDATTAERGGGAALHVVAASPTLEEQRSGHGAFLLASATSDDRLTPLDPPPDRASRDAEGHPHAPAGALRLIDALREFVERPRIAIRNCAPNRVEGATWGDSHFAESLADAFARRGFEAAVHPLSEWDDPSAHTYDVVIQLRGLHRYRPHRGAVNVLWVISHPELVTDDELDEFDLVLVASTPFARNVRERTSRPVQVLHQATDPHRFHPVHRTLTHAATGIVVVANARWPYRRAPRWLLELGRDFSLFGANWDRFPESRFLADAFVPNERLSDIYATADVVVADQWDHMAREGFVANRLFDVAASGGFVISDDGPGVREIFGGLVPTYSTRRELDARLRRYLSDPSERDRLAREAMRLVRSEHTFDARAGQLLRLLGDAGLLARRTAEASPVTWKPRAREALHQ